MNFSRFAKLIPLVGLLAGIAGGPSNAVWAKDSLRVAEGPYITGGALFIAQDKGYFAKMGLDVTIEHFSDGTLAMPAMIAGEVEIAFQGAAANLFNSIAKGAPLTIFLDRGSNRAGRAYTTSVIGQGLYDQGVRSLADFAKLRGKKIGMSGLGSINHYTLSLALLNAGLDPANDVQWIVNIPQPDLMKMLGQRQIDAMGAAYNIAVFGQNNGLGHLIGTDDEVAPGGQIGVYAVRANYLAQHRDVVVRWTMAYLHAAKEFNAAAADPDRHPEIVEILTKNTVINKPEVIKAIAPHWSYISEDGIPNVKSIIEMQDFWSGKYFKYVDKKVSRKRLFDLTIAKEAKSRLDREKPFSP